MYVVLGSYLLGGRRGTDMDQEKAILATSLDEEYILVRLHSDSMAKSATELWIKILKDVLTFFSFAVLLVAHEN